MYRSSFIIALIFAVALASIVMVLSSQTSKLFEWIVSVLVVVIIVLVTTGRPIGIRGWTTHAARTVAPAEEAASAEEEDELDPRGVWSGTATVWPARRTRTIELHSLRLRLFGDPLRLESLPVEVAAEKSEPAGVELLEHDRTRGNIDLRVVVKRKGRRRVYTARLTPRAGGLFSEDDTDPCTVELFRKASHLKADSSDDDDELADVARC